MTTTSNQKHIEKRKQLRNQIKTTNDETAKNNIRRQIIDDEIKQNQEEANDLNNQKRIIENNDLMSYKNNDSRDDKINQARAFTLLAYEQLGRGDKQGFKACMKIVCHILKGL